MEKYELNIKVEPTKGKLTCVHRKIIQSTYVTFGAEVPVAKRTLARKLEILTRIGMCKEGYYQNDQGGGECTSDSVHQANSPVLRSG